MHFFIVKIKQQRKKYIVALLDSIYLEFNFKTTVI
jgi:hypothetical protein